MAWILDTHAKGKGKPELPPRPPDHYTALRCWRDDSGARLTKAYKRRALTEHPDKGGTTKRFQALEEAYRVLSDPTLRAAYEREAAAWEARSKKGAAKAKGKGTEHSTAASSTRASAAASAGGKGARGAAAASSCLFFSAAAATAWALASAAAARRSSSSACCCANEREHAD